MLIPWPSVYEGVSFDGYRGRRYLGWNVGRVHPPLCILHNDWRLDVALDDRPGAPGPNE